MLEVPNILFDFSGIRRGRKTAGTRGALAECPGGGVFRGGSRCGLRDAWRFRMASRDTRRAWKVSGRGGFTLGTREHVALSEGKAEEGFEGDFEGGGFRRGGFRQGT